ncbi:MAG: hypothetical protein ACREKM_10180 [Longimicrobiales bacterium]
MVPYEDGAVFATPSLYRGRQIMRMAFSNWRTDRADVARIVEALRLRSPTA